MVKVKKAAKSGGKLRTKRHKVPVRHNSKAFTRSSHADPGLDIEDELFTLRDVVRHTSSLHSDRQDSNSHLRDKVVNFVKSVDVLQGTLHETEENLALKEPHVLESQSTHTQPLESAGLDCATKRVVSPTFSDSSDEIVHFNGRNKLLHPSPSKHVPSERFQSSSPPGLSFKTGSSNIPSAFNSIPSPSLLSHNETISSLRADRKESVHHRISLANDPSLHLQTPFAQEGRSGAEPNISAEGSLDASLADYMQNMWTHGELGDNFGSQARSLNHDIGGWDASDLANFDDISTSDEIDRTVDLVLARRQRQSGLQYLIVWQGQSVDEARWIHHDMLSMHGANEHLRQFEEQERQIKAIISSNSDSSTDTKEEGKRRLRRASNGGTDSSDTLDDDDSLAHERMVTRMADEQIARLLSKQEEHGMGSDELILFDDLDHGRDFADQAEDFVSFSAPQKTKNKKTKRRWQKKEDEHYFDSHDDLPGDNYGSFDIMDFDRPSISKKSKANKEPLFDLSDSELEAELREQFAADRRNKKAKKQERDELRSKGLLGRKNKFRPDMNVRYKDGLSLSQLKHEMEEFLFNDAATLTLPPMGKSERKTVHQIASQFNLKSKSVGSGKSRYPTLHKTPRTIDFDAALFNRAERKFHSRFLPRMDKHAKERGHTFTRTGASAMTSGTGYAEGEAVGASAPELGSDNRGRAMLEKMGWSTGMALGALDNKGILQPITHTVKKTRAGLG